MALPIDLYLLPLDQKLYESSVRLLNIEPNANFGLYDMSYCSRVFIPQWALPICFLLCVK